MSTLQVSNVHFESTGNNRLQYTGSNSFNIVAGGSTVATVNTTAIDFPLGLDINDLTANSLTANSLTVSGNVAAGSNAVSVNYEMSLSSETSGSTKLIRYSGGIADFKHDGGNLRLVNDTTSGNIIFQTESTERFRIGANGQLGIGGANFGTAGQVLTSNGSNTAPSWQDAFSGAFTTLSFSSNQTFTSSTEQKLDINPSSTGLTITFPDATTLTPATETFVLNNVSNFDVTIKADDGNTLYTLAKRTLVTFDLIDNGSTNGNWSISSAITDTLYWYIKESFNGAFGTVGANDTTAYFGAVAMVDAAKISSNSFVYAYMTDLQIRLRVGTYASGSVTAGSSVLVYSAASRSGSCKICMLSETSGIVVYSLDGDLRGVGFTISGQTITIGTESRLINANYLVDSIAPISSTSALVISSSAANVLRALIVNWSGSGGLTPQDTSAPSLDGCGFNSSNAVEGSSAVVPIDSSNALVVTSKAGGGADIYNLRLNPVSISGTASWGTSVDGSATIDTISNDSNLRAYAHKISDSEIVCHLISGISGSGSTVYVLEAVVDWNSGTPTITSERTFSFSKGSSTPFSIDKPIWPSNDRFIFPISETDDNDYGTRFVAFKYYGASTVSSLVDIKEVITYNSQTPGNINVGIAHCAGVYLDTYEVYPSIGSDRVPDLYIIPIKTIGVI